jgi:5-methylcytosine-specific restriction endonuclease McrA
MNTVVQPMYGWSTLPWKKFQRNVFKLQKRIYQASQRGDVKTVRKCGRFFKDGEAMEMDHIIPKEWGGSDSRYNWQLLHRHCHDVKTARDKTLAA